MKKIIEISLFISIGLLIVFGLSSNNIYILKKEEIKNPIKEGINNYLRTYYAKYPDLEDVLKEAKISLPNEKVMVPQGITLMDNYILVSAYNSNSYTNSICYVIDQNGKLINMVYLDNPSHVGGLAYDKENDLVWIPGEKGILNAYFGQEFLSKQEIKPKFSYNNVVNCSTV